MLHERYVHWAILTCKKTPHLVESDAAATHELLPNKILFTAARWPRTKIICPLTRLVWRRNRKLGFVSFSEMHACRIHEATPSDAWTLSLSPTSWRRRLASISVTHCRPIRHPSFRILPLHWSPSFSLESDLLIRRTSVTYKVYYKRSLGKRQLMGSLGSTDAVFLLLFL